MRADACRPASTLGLRRLRIAPYAVLPDGRQYRTVPGAPDLIAAFKAGTIPHVPQGIVELIHPPHRENQQAQPSSFNNTAGAREKAFAQVALQGCTAELAAMPRRT